MGVLAPTQLAMEEEIGEKISEVDRKASSASARSIRSELVANTALRTVDARVEEMHASDEVRVREVQEVQDALRRVELKVDHEVQLDVQLLRVDVERTMQRFSLSFISLFVIPVPAGPREQVRFAV